MLTAKEAQTNAKSAKPPKWNRRDERELKKILKLIDRQSKKGETHITHNPRPLVSKKLEELGYRIEGHGAWDSWWTTIHW